jgi:hypothetical protein
MHKLREYQFIVVVVQVVGAGKKKCSSNGGAQERQDETQFTTKIGGKTHLGPSYFVL